jgi:hypothetical protein
VIWLTAPDAPYDGPLPDHTEYFDRVADLAASSVRLSTDERSQLIADLKSELAHV